MTDQGSHETLAIFHDHFRDQDFSYFSKEINFWTISETTRSMTIFLIQNSIKSVIFHDHFHGWDSCKFFKRNSSLDNFDNCQVSDYI